MAANLAQLSNSVTDLISGIGAELGILPNNEGSFYPTDVGVEDGRLMDLTNWNKLAFPYTFDVINSTGISTGQFKEFKLPLAPNKITQTEMPAKSIKATQGGTVVTHSGNRYKKLMIEGTTGINPFRGMTGVDITTGQAIAKPKELKFKSGYEVFRLFRNYLKAYEAFKSKPTALSRDARLIFKNFKDGEFLIVELMDFTMDRSAERGLLYDYKIEFKVIAEFKFEAPALGFFENLDAMINKVVSKIDVARGIFLGVQETLRQIESSYNSTVLEPMRKVGLAAKALAGIAITASDIGNRIIKNTVTAADSLNIFKVIKEQQELAKTGQSATVPTSFQNASLPNDLKAAAANNGAQGVIDLNETLLDVPLAQMPESTQDAMIAEVDAASALPRSFYENTVKDLKRIKANAEDAFNLGSDTYDEIFDRTATLKSEDAKIATPEEFELLGAFNDSIVAINTLISFPNLFKSEFERKIETIEEQFIDSLDLQALPAVKTITIPANTDLEQIALDELRDHTRWVEIAELNDLNAPYITQDLTDTRTGVKKPGEKLLVPQEIQFGLAEAPRAKDIPSTDGLSEAERALGTDLKLTKDMDLDLANNGDLAVISGADNMGQAVVLHIGYEKGELKQHPDLGVGVQVGRKFISLEQVRDNLIGSLTQDKRVESVDNVSLLREGPALYMNFNVNLKQVDTPIPLTVRL